MYTYIHIFIYFRQLIQLNAINLIPFNKFSSIQFTAGAVAADIAAVSGSVCELGTLNQIELNLIELRITLK